MSLKGKTLFITGASRGIGKAIALRAARDGANIVVAAKTATPHPKLPGTIYSAAKEIEKLGGKALPVVCDIRDEAQVQSAIDQAVSKFGGIDIVVNNASAIAITNTEETSMKRYDLMNQVNARGTFLVSKTALPHLRKSNNPHILMLSPPLSMQARWFGPHVAYTIAKYGMSMCVLGLAEELKKYNIAVNALWPYTVIGTSALNELAEANIQDKHIRTPEIMADAAHVVLCQDAKDATGQFYIDEAILRQTGVKDFAQYQFDPKVPMGQLLPDFFIDEKADALVAQARSGQKSKL
ncbi:Hydroxysteroid dehydrogenase-like protein 2 [Dimargaris verticillata]|uniref:Hydroxysteroid dehydrogenase-like protein 2 n=1 Tax=Dimargaris verticillata TaxID=2761393 RepID=A0A9W8B755_9FUNG|nr:Hydroxysteroid dehydrogenase-like protein 2 [Dimargaris verticillata]